jgi:hypothetical protein
VLTAEAVSGQMGRHERTPIAVPRRGRPADVLRVLAKPRRALFVSC